MGGKNLKSVNQ